MVADQVDKISSIVIYHWLRPFNYEQNTTCKNNIHFYTSLACFLLVL